MEKRKYWYKLYIGECPVCGCDVSYRIRSYESKPLKKEDQYIYLSSQETYDGCMY